MALPAPTEQDLARYDGYHRQLDTEQTGKITKAQAAPLLNRAGLKPAQLARLWTIADTSGDNRLNNAEFRTAMHVATLALQGHPGAQGMLRADDAAGAQDEQDEWALDEADVMRYDGYFRMLETNGSTHVSQQQARPLFDRAGAPFLPVITRVEGQDEPQLWGALFHVDALKTYTRALAATAAEEHS